MKRFWDKVDKSGECWEWTAHTGKGGYGRFRVNGKTVDAHRFVLELEGSDIPSSMCVCHTCDNRRCVNPDHLFLGTRADNHADMRKKNRGNTGEKNGSVKLTEKDVKEIRRSEAKQSEIAKAYGVSNGQISGIKNRRYWKHI